MGRCTVGEILHPDKPGFRMTVVDKLGFSVTVVDKLGFRMIPPQRDSGILPYQVWLT